MFYEIGKFIGNLPRAPFDLMDGLADGLAGDDCDDDRVSDSRFRCASCGRLNEDFEHSKFCTMCKTRG